MCGCLFRGCLIVSAHVFLSLPESACIPPHQIFTPLTSSNTLKESELKTFCPHTPPYTNYVSGPNGKAFRSDTAVVLATLFWERGKIPPAFTWLREIEERNKQSRLAGGPEDQSSLEKGEDSTANSSFTSTHSHKKSGSISVAGTPRRASQVSLVGQHPPSPATNGARKDSNSSKDPLRKVDKTIRKVGSDRLTVDLARH
ncbi:hypothetical protein DFS34DRAFT_192839 [Phlyctochytrium arcticum]|nr:hypothetical protein DFS34DRAFT_192839 [Phlyctochytrium arcticum]